MFTKLFGKKTKKEIVQKPEEIGLSTRFIDKPNTIDEHYLGAINTVASWMSYLGRVSRTHNRVILTSVGKFRRNNLDFEYDVHGEYNAMTGLVKVEGFIRYYDSHMMEYGRRVYIYESDPSIVYRALNELYKETAYNTKS